LAEKAEQKDLNRSSRKQGVESEIKANQTANKNLKTTEKDELSRLRTRPERMPSHPSIVY